MKHDNHTAKTLETHRRLLDYYGEPTLKERRDPLSELVVTILSQNTADVNTDRAYRALQQRFPAWEEVLAAPVEELAEAIRVAGLANIKAPRIRRILEDLQAEQGRLDLGFLEAMTVDEAKTYLMRLHGVGPKTAACVLLFSLHKPALPVDTHVLRVSRRVGLVPRRPPRPRPRNSSRQCYRPTPTTRFTSMSSATAGRCALRRGRAAPSARY